MLQQSELVKLKEEIARITSKIKSTSKELSKKKEEKRRHAQEVEKLENDLMDVTKQLEDLREKSQGAGGKLQLVDSELETYHQMLVTVVLLITHLLSCLMVSKDIIGTHSNFFAVKRRLGRKLQN